MADLNKLTVLELKKLLKQQGAKVSGKKSELILRLNNLTNQKYISIEDDITEKGSQTKMNYDDEIESVKGDSNEYHLSNKKVTQCPFCSQTIQYPSDYFGKLVCPSCRNQIILTKPSKMPIEGLLFLSSLLVVLLTIIIYIIYIKTNDGGEYAVFYGGSLIWFWGLLIAGGLFICSMISILLRIMSNIKT
jgi:hypothetical protein